MPTKRKTKLKNTRKPTKKITVSRPHVSSSQGSSYDTMMIITILLLIFVYPVGIVCMWLLMKTWPTWLKVVITLPLLIAVFFTIVVVYVIGRAVSHVDWRRTQMNQQRYEQMMEASPTPTVSPYRF